MDTAANPPTTSCLSRKKKKAQFNTQQRKYLEDCSANFSLMIAEILTCPTRSRLPLRLSAAACVRGVPTPVACRRRDAHVSIRTDFRVERCARNESGLRVTHNNHNSCLHSDCIQIDSLKTTMQLWLATSPSRIIIIRIASPKLAAEGMINSALVTQAKQIGFHQLGKELPFGG